jgi:hypothetical protein
MKDQLTRPETTTDPALLDALYQAAKKAMSADDIRKQRYSWCFGQTHTSFERVKEVLDRG